MSLLRINLALILIITCLVGLTSTRELPSPFEPIREPIEVRLGADGGGLVDCWNALLQLRTCTNEIVLFFLNGESYLGLECCRAIRVITRQCWPSMLSSLGFTSEEGDILRGYCDAEPAPPSPDATSSPPPLSLPRPPPATAPTGSAVADDLASDEIVV